METILKANSENGFWKRIQMKLKWMRKNVKTAKCPSRFFM